MKIFIFSLIGACCSFAILFALFPFLSRVFVGPVVSDDEMNQNVVLFLIGAPLFVVIGALVGGLLMRHRLNRKNRHG